MSLTQPRCASSGSTDRPTTLTLRLSNSGLSADTRPSSVVQTGVKSLGCENRTPQLVPRYWWKLIGPSVVSAVKSGASSPSCNAMAYLRCRDLGSVLVFALEEGKPDPIYPRLIPWQRTALAVAIGRSAGALRIGGRRHARRLAGEASA